jgi:putative colanic acid biosynthesis acetyltransferase WcaF
MRLDRYTKGDYHPGANICIRVLWYFLGSPLLRWELIPFSWIRVVVLRVFGARIGRGVRIKPGVRIKHPWRFELGDFSWLGEKAWIDNIAPVSIGAHCCISQNAYLCTGNHDWRSDSFDLLAAGINVGSHSWIAANAVVGPGVTVGEGAVLLLGSVASGDLESWQLYRGNPAMPLGPRKAARQGS